MRFYINVCILSMSSNNKIILKKGEIIMRLLMKVTTRRDPLHHRKGPSISVPSRGLLRRHSEHVFTETKNTSDGWRWCKMERDGSWACMYRADYRETYLTIIKDLTPPPKPPAPPPPPPPPPRDYGKVNDSLNDFADIDKDNIKFSGKGAWGTTAMSGVTDLLPITGRSTVASDELIAKNLRIIKSNLNILQDDYSFYSRMFFNFDRYKVALPDYHLTKTFSRVFFTRPSLHLINASDKSLTTQ